MISSTTLYVSLALVVAVAIVVFGRSAFLRVDRPEDLGGDRWEDL